MIGFQCSPSAQTSGNPIRGPPSPVSSPNGYQLNTASSSSVSSPNGDEPQLSIKREPIDRASGDQMLASLTNHIGLVSQLAPLLLPDEAAASAAASSCDNSDGSGSPTTPTGSTASSIGRISSTSSSAAAPVTSAATVTGNCPPQLTRCGLQSASSPGYHSAASSPTSSVASPVSSSSSVASGGSSGVSTASSLSSTLSSSTSTLTCQNIASNNNNNNGSRGPILPNLLDYYPELNQDGLGLSWFHDANNRTKLGAALMTNRIIVSGDISLAEMSRYPVPIMARPPLGISDITLDNWLQDVIHSHSHSPKGIKLTFTSTRTVEPAFRVLARHAEYIKGPLILNADILTRPAQGSGAAAATNRLAATTNRQQQHLNVTNNGQQQQQQPVDAWTFLMLCRTRFPKSIISIGWCAPTGSGASAGGFWQSSGVAPRQEHQPMSLADSSASSFHSSADSMFELDIMDTTPSSASTLSQLAQQASSHFGHLQHLSHQQHRIHQHLHPYPLISHHTHQQHRQQLSAGHHRDHHLNLSHHHHHHHHHILSSTGSLNSSSGNSSGSPSPTSPISQLMSPPHQTVATNLSLGAKAVGGGCLETGAEQAGSKQAAAAAAAMAAVVAASTFQQMPLNLNINEADQQQLTSSSAASLTNLAHKIQSYQSIQQHNLTNQANNDGAAAAVAAAALSNKLFGQQLQQQQQSANKKTALSSSVGSPQSSSPKQQMQHSSSNLLLKTTGNQQQPNSSSNSAGCYTREMIDKMASLVKEYNLTQPVTFPVEARMLRNSLGELQRLLYQVGTNSTLTVVARQEDLIGVDDLLTIRKSFATNQLLFDLPDDLAVSLRQELDLL